jgi:predicted DCC family thiol-disulfide oxidoreductase YuxK
MKNIEVMNLTSKKKLLFLCLSLIGAMVIITGVVFNPSFVAKHLSPDGILDKPTVVRIYILQALVISFGLIVCLYSLIKITNNVFAREVDEKVVTNLILAWNRYWFAPTSLRRLAIFRILIFGFLIVDSLSLQIPGCIEGLKRASPEFFNPLLIIRILRLGPPPSPFVLDIIYVLLLLFAVGAMIGFVTRFCILGSVALYAYIIGMWWSFEGIHHSEEIFIFAMTALLLSPCGKVLSVDELLARVKESKKRGEFQRNRPENLESEFALWPIRLVQVLIALIYFNAGFWKLKLAGPSWADGVTLQFHLIRHYFLGQYVSELGFVISQYPTILKTLSVLTLVWELGFPIILIVPKLAWIWLPMGLLFHIGTGFTMDTWFFHFWFLYVAFINFESFGSWIKGKLRIPYNSPGLKVLFDGNCPLCIRSMTFIAYLDWLRRIEFVDLRNWEEISKSFHKLDREDCFREMHVVDKNSKIHKGFYAYRCIAKYLPVFWIAYPLLLLPGVSLIGDWLYRWFASRRARGTVACTIHNCK